MEEYKINSYLNEKDENLTKSTQTEQKVKKVQEDLNTLPSRISEFAGD